MASVGNAPNEWLKLNGPFNLKDATGFTIRYADQGARTAGAALNTIQLRTGSQSGPVVASFPITAVGTLDTWKSMSFPLPKIEGLNELYLTVTSSNTTLINWVQFDGPGVTRITAPPVDGTVGGNVPATLSLTLGAPASFGPFTPGVEKTYDASTTANVISTAGDATLSVAPSPAYLTNGAFTLAEPLQVALSKSTWTAPVSNETVNIAFKQLIKRTDPLRTGNYSKTLTFTLSTTTP
jgi:hypothetical protein